MIITATLIQYANGTFFVQAPGSNINEVAGQISTFGVLTASLIPNLDYGITILPPEGTSYSRFGALFTAQSDGTQDITAILTAAIPPPVSGSLPDTTNLISGDGTGGGADSGLAPSNVMRLNSGASIQVATSTNFTPLAVESNSSLGVGIGFIPTDPQGHQWVMGSGATSSGVPGQFFFEDATNGNVPFTIMANLDGSGFFSVNTTILFGWLSPTVSVLDTGFSRGDVAGEVKVGNGTLGDESGQITSFAVKGPAVAPTGAGPAGTWCFSQDGKISFCNAGTWEVIVP